MIELGKHQLKILELSKSIRWRHSDLLRWPKIDFQNRSTRLTTRRCHFPVLIGWKFNNKNSWSIYFNRI